MSRRPTAAILVTGSEILLGRTQDRNSGTLARSLDGHGIRLERIVAVDDREEHLHAALADLVNGGYDLGVDDVALLEGLIQFELADHRTQRGLC